MRVINADKMIEDTERMKQVADGIEIGGIIKYINENAIEELSAEWIPTKDTYGCGGGDYGFKCSNCKARVKRKDVIKNTHPYCYRCGAKMKKYEWISREIES